jgi:hypothetical protein
MAEKTEKNPRGAGRKKKIESEKTVYFTVCAPRHIVEAITALARKSKTTKGRYIQRLLEVEAARYVDEGKRGRLLGELYAVALDVFAASGAVVSRLEKMKADALDCPAVAFPKILERCSFELSRVTLANGRETFKSKIADLTVALGFAFPETLTDEEREAFETAVEKYFETKLQ